DWSSDVCSSDLSSRRRRGRKPPSLRHEGARTLLAVPTCPNCGRDNPEGFAFCGFCSAPLEQPAQSRAEERKVVSVLFVDLVGFTAASEAADPEDVRARLVPYHAMLKR